MHLSADGQSICGRLSIVVYPQGRQDYHNPDFLADLVRADLGGRKLFFGLCSRSGFTSQVEQEAAERGDLLLFDLPEIVER